MGAAGFHQLGSDFADARIAAVREKLERGETVYLAGIGPPGTHNSGVALVEVTQAHGPRLIVNNEEERFSGNKHTTEYPRASIDALAATLRGMGRDIGDIAPGSPPGITRHWPERWPARCWRNCRKA